MKTIKSLNFFMLMLFAIYTYGQDTLKNNKREFIISTNIPQIFCGDYVTSSISIPLGIEFKINDKFGFHQDIAYIIQERPDNSGLVPSPHASNNLKGFRLDSELKKYLNNKKNFSGFYLSTAFFYQYTKDLHAYASETTYRNVLALHEKFGWEIVGPYGDFFDVALGIGIRYETSKTIAQGNLSVFNQYVTFFYMYSKPYQYGNKLFFSVNGTLRLGRIIRMKNKKI
jgi:hypothetical protein